MRGLTTGILSGWQENAAEKTDFATLGASFKIAKGQAQTADLASRRAAGAHDRGGDRRPAGQDAEIPRRSATRRKPRGQGGKSDLQGLGVPIMIAGPWAKPSIYPDIEGILKDPAAAYQQLNRLGGGLVSLPGAGNTGSVSGHRRLDQERQGRHRRAQARRARRHRRAARHQQPQSADEAEAPAPAPAAKAKPKPKPVSDAAPSETKKSKKRQAAAEPSAAPQEAANQLLQNFLGN